MRVTRVRCDVCGKDLDIDTRTEEGNEKWKSLGVIDVRHTWAKKETDIAFDDVCEDCYNAVVDLITDFIESK